VKILQMHADFIEFQPIKKEIAVAEESGTEKVREEDVLVLFTAVEQGDDEDVARRAVSDAGEFARKLGVKRLMVYPFAHISQNLAKPADALPVLRAMKEVAGKSGLSVSSAPFGWNKALQIKVKGHPLAEMSRSYTPVGGETKVQQRRAMREPSHDELLSRMKKVDHSGLPEGDHRVIGEKLDLFSFYEPSPSMPYWHDRGLTLRNLLIETIRSEIRKRGYVEISTALMANVELWKVSGHWEHYKDNMFVTKLREEEEESFGLKPMNCPSTILYYMSRRWSYRDLPLRIADFDTLHRKELSGVVTGLFRVKSFMQDDAHIFCTDEQVGDELRALIDLVDHFYGIFKLEYTPRVSTMPDQHLGTEEQWRRATEILVEAVKSKGITPVIKEKEGAFYGPKIDVDVRDSLGREWQCATIQLDFQLPQRFNLTYTGADGKEHTPVMIHRVIYGSLERFIGIILEHFKGRLPFWLSPVQVRVIPVSGENTGYARDVLSRLTAAGLRAEGDFEPGTVSAKVRNAQLAQVPVMVVVGQREQESGRISLRERDGSQRNGVTVEEFLDEARKRVASFT
jgi:threonyl-tRNA synthetase